MVMNLMSVLMPYLFLGPIKLLIYYFFLKSQSKIESRKSYFIRSAFIRIFIGIVFGFFIFQWPLMLGFAAPPGYERLGYNPLFLLLLIPARPLEWWILMNIGKLSFYIDPDKKIQFIVKGTVISFITDALSIGLAVLGIIAMGGIC
jgi:hypothetical protein